MTRGKESDTEEIFKPGKARTSSWRAEVLRSEQERMTTEISLWHPQRD